MFRGKRKKKKRPPRPKIPQAINMKSGLSIVIFLVFASLAIFGVFLMGNMNEHRQDCLAAAINGAICPESMSPLASINFHFDAFQKFSLAVFQNTLLLISFLLVLVFVARILSQHNVTAFILSGLNFKRTNSNKNEIIRKFIHWLSLFENSPSILK